MANQIRSALEPIILSACGRAHGQLEAADKEVESLTDKEVESLSRQNTIMQRALSGSEKRAVKEPAGTLLSVGSEAVRQQ